MPPVHPAIEKWVKEIAALTTPDQIVYCDGSAEEGERLTKECLATGELIELNQKKMPGCYLHRSATHDVARALKSAKSCIEYCRLAPRGPTTARAGFPL